MGFPRQEQWSGLPRPPPGDLPDPGIEPSSLMSPSIGRQVLLSMGFSRQKYWSGLPRPPPGDIPGPRIKPMSLVSLIYLRHIAIAHLADYSTL